MRLRYWSCCPRKGRVVRKDFELLDTRLEAIFQDAELERLCTGAIWGEGPVWIPKDKCVLWSDIPNNRMLRWSESDGMCVWAEKVEFTNGHTLDQDGSLLHCSHGLRGVYRSAMHQGVPEPVPPFQCVVDSYQGKRLNSPNDIIVKRDGSIWFTDPPYGILSDREGYKAERELSKNHVFCYDPSTNVLDVATDWVDEPNGLAFSPDESILYVSDTSAALAQPGHGNHHIVAFDVIGGRKLANPRVFAVIQPGLPDGFRVDQQGWIYTSSGDSVQIYDTQGILLGKIMIPEKVGNLCFGGQAYNELYITASTSLYRVKLNTKGISSS
jgi:gluconolactonase